MDEEKEALLDSGHSGVQLLHEQIEEPILYLTVPGAENAGGMVCETNAGRDLR